MSLRGQAKDEEIVDAELVEDGELMRARTGRPLVDMHTVLMPGEAIPTSDDPGVPYTRRDLDLSPETQKLLQETDPTDSGPMRAFREWCAEQERVAWPCTTATYTEYSRHLMSRGLKVTTIQNYMSRIKTAMPPGSKPDNSLFLRLLATYRKKNKRALRRKEAFPLTIAYVVPMMEKAEADDRPIGWRDAALFSFGYRFLGRSRENVDADLEDLTILDDRIVVWLAEDKTHKGEEQTIVLHDRTDLQLVFRMRRWVGYLKSQGITTGPVFREVLRSGKIASLETRMQRGDGATERGAYLRPQTVNERVKLWFERAGLHSDGRPVSSQGLRAGAATDLGVNDATDQELEAAGRWAQGSRIPRERYVRPAKDAAKDPFKKVPVNGARPSMDA